MATNGDGEVDIYALPEECVANALSLTSPQDACRLSAVGSTFRSAAESDAVWERFLPSDYREVISRSIDRSQLNFASKKDLYLYLCDHPLIIDGGTKSFSLEKYSGKKCYMLAARDLLIVWGDAFMYWQWPSLPESRFSEVAQLSHVWWLEIRGKINTSMLSPNTTYAAYLVFKLTEEAYGFENQAVEVSVGLSEGGGEMQTVYFDHDEGQRPSRFHMQPGWRIGRQRRRPIRGRGSSGQYCKQRADGWLEIGLGEYVNEGGEDGDLEMSLMEVKSGLLKSGLIVQGIEIRPQTDQNS